MRLIDADAIAPKLEGTYNQTMVRYAPKIDAVPVVRCRECKLRRKSKQFPNNHYCLKSGLVVYPDDFCSYGEQKEGAD